MVEKIKPLAAATARIGANPSLGGFGALFDLKAIKYKDPILVASNDGVGTKLLVAIEQKNHSTIGEDLVAMSVNDLIAQGAEPLFFLDYLCSGQLNINQFESIVKGIANGCKKANCALIGGETAEMPGLYSENKYDMAGFSVGVVEREKILPQDVQEGDIVLGIPSSGFHSNGHSLIRKIIKDKGLNYNSSTPFDSSQTLGEALLKPTKIYVESCLPLIKKNIVKALAHITGGGLIENIPRILPNNLGVELNADSFNFPDIMKWLGSVGNVSSYEMARTFNCGVGMVCIIESNYVQSAKEIINSSGEEALFLGKVIGNSSSQNRVRINNINDL